MTARQIIDIVSQSFDSLDGQIFDVISVAKPKSFQEAVNLSKIISKLSPLVGNLIEYRMVDFFNSIPSSKKCGVWKRQDPGFPDAIFESKIFPAPGFEIKAWFPLATEITARFKDSQKFFMDDQTNVLLVAWLPEFVIYGRPKILGVCNVSAKSIAKTRDDHYFNPPDYLILEPEDTSLRTRNLQQTNTNGYKFQGSDSDFKEAVDFFKKIKASKTYSPDKEYQVVVRKIFERSNYRLDTNYAKIDRIGHSGIETFKSEILYREFNGLPIEKWARVIASDDEQDKLLNFASHLDI